MMPSPPPEIIVSVPLCPRCTETHEDVRFIGLTRSISGDYSASDVKFTGLTRADHFYTHWALCPSTAEPLLLRSALVSTLKRDDTGVA